MKNKEVAELIASRLLDVACLDINKVELAITQIDKKLDQYYPEPQQPDHITEAKKVEFVLDDFKNEMGKVLLEKVDKYGDQFLSDDDNICTIDGLYNNQYVHSMELAGIIDKFRAFPEIINGLDRKRAMRLCVHIANRQMMIFLKLKMLEDKDV